MSGNDDMINHNFHERRVRELKMDGTLEHANRCELVSKWK